MSREQEKKIIDLKDKSLDEETLRLIAGGEKRDCPVPDCTDCPLPMHGLCDGHK